MAARDVDRPPAERAVRRVVAGFGFADSQVERVEALPRRLRNVNYRVRAGDSDWVVKAHALETGPAVARLHLAHALETRLADAGFPVARIRRTAAGETLVADGDTRFTMHAWVDGQQVTISERERLLAHHPELVAELASTLGVLHRISGTLDVAGPDGADAGALLRAPRHTARRLRRPRPPLLLSPRASLRLRPRKSAFDRWILATLPAVTRRAERLSRSPLAARLEDADVLVLHNDVNWENLVFDEDFRLRALLDFDNAVRAPRELEVGAAAVVLVGADRERLDEFLEVYERAAQVAVDRDVVGVAMELKCVQSILNSVATYLRGGVAEPGRLAAWTAHLAEALDELAPR